MFENKAPLDPRLAHIGGMVEATSFERNTLWYMHAKDSPNRDLDNKKMHWEQDMSGFLRQIGELDDKPVMIECSFAIIDSFPICFYDSPGRFVDWGQVTGWVRAICTNRVDAMNFCNVFYAHGNELLARFRAAQAKVHPPQRLRVSR